MKEYRILAPAKINLHLEVTGRRADGFHDLISLFQIIDLYDQIDLSLVASGIKIEGCPGIPLEQNLIHKAAVKFLQKTHGTSQGLNFCVVKNIPCGAGLGGGSSDAAAVLKLLNEVLQKPLSEDELFDLGMELGSDVGFFLRSPAALVEGRGEKVTPILPRDGLSGIVVFPGVPTQTALAYRALGLTGHRAIRLNPEAAVDQYKTVLPSQWTFFNDFFPVTRHKSIDQALLRLEKAVFKGLSGSGSAVFGIYESEEAAFDDFIVLNRIFPKTMKIKMLVKFPPLALKLEPRG